MYNSTKSSTYKANDKSFSIYYDDDDVGVTGFLSQDSVTIGNMTVKNQIFAQAKQFPANVYDVNFGIKFG